MSNATSPAFPTPEFYDEKVIGTVGGLTKRELFAAMAMQGIIAQMPKAERAEELARQSVVCADALLAQLAK